MRNIKEIEKTEDGFSSLKNQQIDIYAPKKFTQGNLPSVNGTNRRYVKRAVH